MTQRSGTSAAPGMCIDEATCLKQPVTYATGQLSAAALPYSTAMGLAKDGHIIVGPYNSSGELWSCDDHDVCNGVFLADNSYAYAMTYTFPYVVGCYGPGPTQVHQVGCSNTSCSTDGSMMGLSLTLSTMITAVIVMAQF